MGEEAGKGVDDDRDLFQALHEPAEALQPLASGPHPLGGFQPSLHPLLGDRDRLACLAAGRKKVTISRDFSLNSTGIRCIP